MNVEEFVSPLKFPESNKFFLSKPGNDVLKFNYLDEKLDNQPQILNNKNEKNICNFPGSLTNKYLTNPLKTPMNNSNSNIYESLNYTFHCESLKPCDQNQSDQIDIKENSDTINPLILSNRIERKSANVYKKFTKLSYSKKEQLITTLMALVKPKNRENKEILDSIERDNKKNIQQAWLERQKIYEKKAQENLSALTEKLQSEKMNNCTFSPQVNSNSTRRTIEEFYQEQENFVHKRETKLKSKNEEIESNKQFTFSPSLNPKTKQITDLFRKGNSIEEQKNVFSRLKSRENNCSEQRKSPNNYTLLFNPKINSKSTNIKRNSNTYDMLYEDALHRVINYNKKLNDKTKKEKAETNKSFMLFKSKLYLVKRFNKEFFEAFDRVACGRPMINYLQMVSLLTMLGFINLKPNSNQDKSNLVYDIWHLLRGDEFEGVSKRNIHVLLLSILGFYSNWMHTNESITNEKNQYIIIEESNEDEENMESEIEKIDTKSRNFMVTQEDAKKLHNYFYELYLSKIKYELSIKELNSMLSISHKKSSNNPQINNKSRQLANSYFHKTLHKFSQKNFTNLNIDLIKHHDFLLLKGAEYDSKRKLKAKENINQDISSSYGTTNKDMLDYKKSLFYLQKLKESKGNSTNIDKVKEKKIESEKKEALK